MQEQINYNLQQLKSLLVRGVLPHAIMLVDNAAGAVAYQIAMLFAQYVFCQLKQDHYSMCSCSGCELFNSNNHPDCFLVNLDHDQEIKIDLIRAINKFASSNFYLVNRKIIIINNFHKINIQAANAFLKTLEEPSVSTEIIFLLITDNPNLLPSTILSRVLQFNLVTYVKSNYIANDNKDNSKDTQYNPIDLLEDLYNVWALDNSQQLNIVAKWQEWPKPFLIAGLWSIMTNIVKISLDNSKKLSISSDYQYDTRKLSLIEQKISLKAKWQLLDSLNYINKLTILGSQINWQLFLYNFIMGNFIERNIYGSGNQ